MRLEAAVLGWVWWAWMAVYTPVPTGVGQTRVPGMVDFDLINDSGYTLRKIWVEYHGSGCWEEVLRGLWLLPGGQVRIQRANPNWIGEGGTWDIRIEYKDRRLNVLRWEVFERLELGHIGVLSIVQERDGRWNYIWETN
jgi:hypothetical protein